MPNQTEHSYSHGTSSTPLLGETIGENLKRVAAAFGGSEVLVDVPAGRRWTYRQFDDDTDVAPRPAAKAKSGSRASAGANADPALRALLEERDKLEDQVAQLRLRKDSMDPARYDQELERLLTDLALKTKAIRDLEARK